MNDIKIPWEDFAERERRERERREVEVLKRNLKASEKWREAGCPSGEVK